MRSATKPPIWRFVFAFVLLLTLADSKAAEVLRLPYEHWGACPFECCTYRKWTSRAVLNARRNRDNRSPVAFRIRQGEVVEALTGVVVTRKPGVVEITETQTFGDVTIPQGAVVYILHFEGGDLISFGIEGGRYRESYTRTWSRSRRWDTRDVSGAFRSLNGG